LSEKDATELLNIISEIINSCDYIPSSDDIEWTRKAITRVKGWLVPSAGCLITCNHELMSFDVIFTTPNNSQVFANNINNFAKIRINLLVLGYSDGRLTIDPDSDSVEDIHRKFGASEEDIDYAKNRGKDVRDELG